MRLLIMGPPGAGKGTQAACVSQHYDVPAISTGDIFRAMDTSDTQLAQQVRAVMAAGGYISDEITNAIVADRLNQSDCDGGFLLDGYPRTLRQAQALDEALAVRSHHLDAVISLVADVDVVVPRLLKRAAVEGRSDDNEETIRKRQAIYADRTAPLLELYRERELLVEVDALGEINDVSERLLAALDRLTDRSGPARPHSDRVPHRPLGPA